MPNEFQSQLGSETVPAACVGPAQKLGPVPSEGGIRLAGRSDSTFPSHSTLGLHIGLQRQRLIRASEYATNNSFDASVVKILADAVKALPDEKIKVDIEVVGGNVTGFVYLMKSGKYHKIGRTNFIERRQYEVGLQIAEKIELVHSMETDDPSGIETYWHRRFRDKHKNGEWFELTASDVRAFKLRKKFM